MMAATEGAVLDKPIDVEAIQNEEEKADDQKPEYTIEYNADSLRQEEYTKRIDPKK